MPSISAIIAPSGSPSTVVRRGEKTEIQKITNETVEGMGKKLGTTYLLPNGEVVYVAENH
jgi:hypothetical protein